MIGPSLNTLKPTAAAATATTIKFLCSYGGKILPRYPDGKLRYHGGETRVLSVQRSISFAELMVKLGELCGSSVSLRCQLPTEDLDALVSITSDEDLANLIEEYDRAASPPSSVKIRAFLSAPKSTKKTISPPLSSAASTSSPEAASPKSFNSTIAGGISGISRIPVTAAGRCFHHVPKPPAVLPLRYNKSAGKLPRYDYDGHGNNGNIHLIHNGNHWQ